MSAQNQRRFVMCLLHVCVNSYSRDFVLRKSIFIIQIRRYIMLYMEDRKTRFGTEVIEK